MKKLWLLGSLLLLIWTAQPARAEWGYPPIGYCPRTVTQCDGTPCADRYGLCAAWKRKHGPQTDCTYGLGGCCEQRTFMEKLRARSGLPCLYP